ncbi:hypothetical protein [Cupriavidus taiwanensis]|uniref:hypothetical protein n=1 Tax=Cupriavidus taiwanensis TaxID=164546 RepID=UPI000E2FED7A|nr:hypothetical protein [Cupriavidus taiwanensis]
MSSPANRRPPPPPTIPQPGLQRAYALIEALGALSIVLAGLLPMAVVGTTGLGWLRELERLAQATRNAADDAELGRCGTALAAVAVIVPLPDVGGCQPAGATLGRP